MKEAKQVHLRDLDGNVKFNILLDDGGPLLLFGGLHPYGFIDRMRLKLEGLVIHEGWLTQEELDIQRMRSPKAKLWLEYATPSEHKRLQAALDKVELKKPCKECPLATELLVSENTPQFSSMSDLLTGLTNKEYSLSCHKYTECGVVEEREQADDPPLCKGALLLKESIAREQLLFATK